jgi:hypothetical protein
VTGASGNGEVRNLFEWHRVCYRRAHTLGVKAVLVAVLASAAVALAGVATANGKTTPGLQVLDRSPLVVRGTGFLSRERVVVTVSISGERTRRGVIATYRGTFAVHFDDIRLDACTGATLIATGRRSQAVSLKIGLRECPGPTLEP